MPCSTAELPRARSLPRVHNCGVAGAPKLEGNALSAVQHRGTHLQIIASAGSGKTEVVAQRVADILADGGDPEAVIAFTFTERAAASLAARISQRVAERCGQDFTDRLNGMFVGTIHAYCFRLLQEYFSEYETYDMLDEHRLAAFLTRESFRLGLKQLDGKLYKSIKAFTKNLDVVENEMLEPGDLEEPFRSVLAAFYERLDTFRLLTYGRLIGIAVAELGNPATREAACGKVRHLIVDEYQDVNPAQEELIRLIAVPPVDRSPPPDPVGRCFELGVPQRLLETDGVDGTSLDLEVDLDVHVGRAGMGPAGRRAQEVGDHAAEEDELRGGPVVVDDSHECPFGHPAGFPAAERLILHR